MAYESRYEWQRLSITRENRTGEVRADHKSLVHLFLWKHESRTGQGNAKFQVPMASGR